jgi:sodium transport system ATP-binding protein
MGLPYGVAVLLATDLIRSFQDPARGPVRAVDGLSISVPAGQVYGLLGPNGAGKTTTLRMLATLLKPDQGSISVDGIDALSDPVGARARMAYVPAEAGLPERLTAHEAVTLFGRVQGVRGARAKAGALLQRLGAHAYADRECGHLSTGMKRRVVLARALIHDPAVLLLDEPTDGLDVQGRREVLTQIRALAAEGRAVVLSSHIMGEVDRVCDRAGIVRDGRKVAEGTLAELRDQAGSQALDDAFVALLEGASPPA